ncbi:MAG: hypothetical protein HKN91_12800 [Acidimicrobiia bacterium]|nr:hypothetical protein [Acidimicrobiia bacterium]
MAVKLYNQTWSLLDEPNRSADQDREMLAAAFGSMYHWSVVGEEKNFAVSDWQVARVLATVGATELAQQFADQALRRAVDGNLGPFLIGCGHEVLARVAAAKGDEDARKNHLARADDILSIIEDPEERDVLKADLDTLR